MADGPSQEVDTRRCFVCFVEEPEANLPQNWCRPCPCRIMQGHQECLLGWVDDLAARHQRIVCPICRARIRVSKRHDPVAQSVKKFKRYWRKITGWFSYVHSLIAMAFTGFLFILFIAGPESAMNFVFRTEATDSWTILKMGNLYFLPLFYQAVYLKRNRANKRMLMACILAVVGCQFGDLRHSEAPSPPSFEYAMRAFPCFKILYFDLAAISLYLSGARWDTTVWGNDRPRSHVDFIHEILTPIINAAVWGIMGELLRIFLPPKQLPEWIDILLQEQWIRSVVAGCTLLFLSNLLRVYMAYRRIINRTHRRIINVGA